MVFIEIETDVLAAFCTVRYCGGAHRQRQCANLPLFECDLSMSGVNHILHHSLNSMCRQAVAHSLRLSDTLCIGEVWPWIRVRKMDFSQDNTD